MIAAINVAAMRKARMIGTPSLKTISNGTRYEVKWQFEKLDNDSDRRHARGNLEQYPVIEVHPASPPHLR